MTSFWGVAPLWWSIGLGIGLGLVALLILQLPRAVGLVVLLVETAAVLLAVPMFDLSWWWFGAPAVTALLLAARVSAATAFITLLFEAALFVRTYGVLQGILYGERPITLATYVCAGLLVMTFATVVRARSKSAPPSEGDAATEGVTATQLFAVVGGLVTLVPVLNLALPADSPGAALPACQSAQIYGTPYQASTTDIGANARSGPGFTYSSSSRYPPSCLLGFDGYCIGEPVADYVFTDRRDMRWFMLPHHDGLRHRIAAVLSGEPEGGRRFVSGGIVQAQDTEADLKELPAAECGEGAPPPPELAKLVGLERDDEVAKSDPPVWTLTATAPHAHDMGIAVWVGPNSTGDEYRVIDRNVTRYSGGMEATWSASATSGTLPAGKGRVVVLVTPCLAPDAPVKDSALASTTTYWLNGQNEPREATRPKDIVKDVKRRLMATACAAPAVPPAPPV